jgi:triosephosphate isomerase (TIM)
MSRPKFIAGNWKMYTTRQAALDLATAVAKATPAGSGVQVGLGVPFPWLSTVIDAVKGSGVKVGGQNCHFEKEGAFTGETSAAMLKDVGCDFVIIGHSERRHGFGESDEFLNKKTVAALATGLEVIFCIGELLAEREAGSTETVLDHQLTHGLVGLTATQLEKVVIAYEPVWAIGTGKVATTEQAQTAHAFVRSKIAKMFGENAAAKVLIQYGGSVKPDNAAALLHQPDIDGALVGGASLKADSFLAIVSAAK